MKNAIVKKIISLLSYEDIITDCPIKKDSGDVRIAKRIANFTKCEGKNSRRRICRFIIY